jgi:precorrin-3B synthase
VAFVSGAARSIRAVTHRESDTDACPGALRLHAAADGLLARVRLPGGLLSGAQLGSLRELAEEFGDGRLELTSRANLQLRALKSADATRLSDRLRDAGLLPSLTHDSVRNIAAPPLADAGTRGLIAQLDASICADPVLASLPGKFLFAIGHVALAADVAVLPAGGRFALRFGGHDTGLRVDAGRVTEALIASAHAFLAEREAQRSGGAAAWRLRELTDGPVRVSARVAESLGITAVRVPVAAPVPVADPGTLVGLVPENDQARADASTSGGLGATDASANGGPGAAGASANGGPGAAGASGDGAGGARVAVGALVPLGRLEGAQARALEDAERLVVTPWRGVLVPGLTGAAATTRLDRMAATGLVVTATSRWTGVSACAGRPGCARSLADVRADADAATRFAAGLPVHWVGCERACGSPAGGHVRVEATPSGYAVTRRTTDGAVSGNVQADGEVLGDVVAAARRA